MAVLALAGAATTARAEPELLDGIAAVVDEEVILTSEVEEELYLASLRGLVDLSDPAAVEEYRKEVVEALIEGKVLLVKARAEGVRATDDEVDAAVERMVEDIRGRFPDDESFRSQLAREGTTVEQLERDYRGKVEEQLIVRQFVDREVRSRVSVDEREIRAYWEEHRDEIPDVPAGLDLSRILVRFDASAVVDSAAVHRAEIVRDRIEAGEDFATLAQVFSEGPAASRGGDLGWFRVDDLDPELAAALEGLGPGATTDVIVTGRGAHLLRVDDVREDGREMRVRQIVFLRDDEAARTSARARAEAILRRLRAGESFEALAAAESDDAATAATGGRIGKVVLEALDPKYRLPLENLRPGEISGLLEDEEGFSIFRVEDREGARAPTFEEVRDRLATLLEQQKASELYHEFLETAREEVYVDNRLLADG
jgi:peptidyl-prolyl cis-trans isomerase SurA